MQHLQNLAHRVRLGDPVAAGELRRELEGGLPSIVRHTLRARQVTLPVHRYILREADRLMPADWDDSPQNQEWLIGQVVQQLCDLMMGGLRSGRGRIPVALETVHR